MKTKDLLGLGLIAGIGYMVIQGGRDLFSAIPSITGSLQQAPAVISQTFNPFDYGGDLLSAIDEYNKAKAEYDAKIAEVEAEIDLRRQQNLDVQETQETYEQDPTATNEAAFLDAYKTAYEQQLAHVKPGWRTLTVDGVEYTTAEEWLGATLASKGLTESQIGYITGSEPTGSPVTDFLLGKASIEDAIKSIPSPSATSPSPKPKGIVYMTDKKIHFDTSVIGRNEVEQYLTSLGRKPTKFKYAGGSEGYWWFT